MKRLLRLLTVPLCLLGAPGVMAEGPLTVYSAGPQGLMDGLATAFEAKTGVPVRVFQSTTGQVLARLESERRNPIADVVITASWNSASNLKEQGLLMAYESPEAARIPDGLVDSHFTTQGVAALAIVWNERSGTPKPADWQDLTDPAYRDQVTMPDPRQSGTAFELVGGLVQDQGEEATWALFEDLAANGLLVPGPNARALNPVLQGAKGVVFGAVDYIALFQRSQGESIEVIFPDSGTVIAPRPMMILESTAQPELARAFYDFVLSREGQQRVADAFLMPIRDDVTLRRPGLDELRQLDTDRTTVGDQRSQILDRFREATQ